MHRIVSIAGAGLAMLLLAGCSRVVRFPLPTFSGIAPPSREAAIERLDDKPPCCRAWTDLPFHDTLPQGPREFTIDHFSPVADLDGLRTHFLTFVLPKFSKPYRIVFKANPSARHLGHSYLLAPTVTLLDANYKPLSTIDVKLCEYIGWLPDMSGAFGAVKVDNENAQYLVVTTSKQQLAASTYWSQSPATYTGTSLPGPASSGNFDLPHGPDGLLAVGMLTPRYDAAVSNGLCGKPDKD